MFCHSTLLDGNHVVTHMWPPSLCSSFSPTQEPPPSPFWQLTRTMVWVLPGRKLGPWSEFPFLYRFTVLLNSGGSNSPWSEFWSEFPYFMGMGVVPAPSSFRKDDQIARDNRLPVRCRCVAVGAPSDCHPARHTSVVTPCLLTLRAQGMGLLWPIQPRTSMIWRKICLN